jgi:hypothetical protein
MYEEEGEKFLKDKNCVRGVTALLSEDPEQLKLIMNSVGKNKAATRYARTMAADKTIVNIAISTSMAEKKAIARSYENRNNTRQTTGIVCALIQPTGYAKKTFIPIGDKLQDLKQEQVNDRYGFYYSTLGGRTNKYAEKITGQPIKGEIYFYLNNGDDLLPDEFERDFPKVVTWKKK